MEVEKKLVEFVVNTQYEDLPQRPLAVMKDVTLNALGAIVSARTLKGSPEAVEQCKEWGGKQEGTILIDGGYRVAASNAAFANSFMARNGGGGDFVSGAGHVGSSSIPTALAVAELVGGCSGKDFLTALVVGTELAARISFVMAYNHFDPTGTCAVFATTAVASRILGLNSLQTWDALGHAFAKAGGSRQANVDNSKGSKVISGAAAQAGITSAQLAQRGITGPKDFLEGVYGYFHLFAGDKYDRETVAGELGKRFELEKTMMKSCQACGATHPTIDAIWALMEEYDINSEEVAEVKVTATPSVYNQTGKPFEYGDDPRTNAVFSIQYNVANILLRKGCKMRHFDDSYVRDTEIMKLINKINAFSDPALEKRGINATAMEVRMADGRFYQKIVDNARGMPENPLTKEELLEIFRDCASYGGQPLTKENIESTIALINGLEEMRDVRSLIHLLI